jgi:hypothetical protein
LRSKFRVSETLGVGSFIHSDREDYFSLDKEMQKLVTSLRRYETKVYFILLLGYFRSRPIVFNFSFSDVEPDFDYVRKKHFNERNIPAIELSPTTKTKLVNKLLKYTGFSLYQNKRYRDKLLERLTDVAKINIEPRYVFDECIAFFGQNRIALAGYTTIQDIISNVLTGERSRIEDILEKGITLNARGTLLKLLESNSTFPPVSG